MSLFNDKVAKLLAGHSTSHSYRYVPSKKDSSPRSGRIARRQEYALQSVQGNGNA